MKTLISSIFFVAFSSVAFAETVNFDGCEGKLVPGTNYYNLVDPRCKTESSKYETTGAEETRKAKAAEEAAKAD